MIRQVDVGSWQAALNHEPSTIVIRKTGTLSLTIPTSQANPQPWSFGGSVIELLHGISGMRPHALLVGEFSPSDSASFDLIIDHSGPFDLKASPVTSLLGLPMRSGLPLDLAKAVEAGIRAQMGVTAPPGTLRISAGAIDHDSAPNIFRKCGELYAAILLDRGDDPTNTIKRHIGSW